MKFSCTSRHLCDALALLMRTPMQRTNTKISVGFTDHIRRVVQFTASTERVTLESVSYGDTLEVDLPATVATPGTARFNLAPLAAWAKGAVGVTDTLECEPSNAGNGEGGHLFTAGSANIAVANVPIELDLSKRRAFVADNVAFTYQRVEMLAIFKRLLPFVSSDQTRYLLNGICLRSGEGKRSCWVATDGRRLAYHDVPPTTRPGDYVIPVDAVMLLRSLLGACKAGAVMLQTMERPPETATGKPQVPQAQVVYMPDDEDRLRWRYNIQLIDGTYPGIEQIIDLAAKNTGSLVVNRKQFAAAIRRLAAVTCQNHGMTMESMNGQVTMSAGNASTRRMASARETMPMVTASGSFKVWFNPHYALDALASGSGETVTLTFTVKDGDEAIFHPVLFTSDPGGAASILMPMRSNGD